MARDLFVYFNTDDFSLDDSRVFEQFKQDSDRIMSMDFPNRPQGTTEIRVLPSINPRTNEINYAFEYIRAVKDRNKKSVEDKKKNAIERENEKERSLGVRILSPRELYFSCSPCV